MDIPTIYANDPSAPWNAIDVSEREANRWYINTDQFTQEEYERLDLLPHFMDKYLEAEADARATAPRAATILGRAVEVECLHIDDDGADVQVGTFKVTA